jgi:hypothetical protein
VGTVIRVKVDDDANLAHWEDEIQVVLSEDNSYEFTVAGKTTVHAVFNRKTSKKVTVSFISGYNQVGLRDQIKSADTLNIPSAYPKTGYVFRGWSIDGQTVPTDLKAAIQEKITEVLATPDTADDIITVRALYDAVKEDVKITVFDGKTTTTKTYNKQDVIQVTAQSVAGKKFSHWSLDNGNILSYNEKYSFYAIEDVNIRAVYVDESATVTAEGTTNMVSITKDVTKRTISFVSLSTVPEGYQIIKGGVILTSDASVANGQFDDTTAMYAVGKAASSLNLTYTATKTNVGTETWYARAYLIYKDADGNTKNIYGDVVSASLND